MIFEREDREASEDNAKSVCVYRKHVGQSSRCMSIKKMCLFDYKHFFTTKESSRYLRLLRDLRVQKSAFILRLEIVDALGAVVGRRHDVQTLHVKGWDYR